MSIAPLECSVTVKAGQARAFDLFTSQIGRWWPAGKTLGENPHVALIIEPHPEGRWFERDQNGVECTWGKVLEWDPPGRVLLGWQLNSKMEYDAAFLTEVELTFTPVDDGTTRVRLEHRRLERFGADADTQKASLSKGWPQFMGYFREFAEQVH